MEKWCALCYPVTHLRQEMLRCLAQLFDAVHVLAPSEDTACPMSDVQGGPQLDVTPIVSSPLGEQLPWFRKVVQGWENWGMDMGLGVGLSATTLLTAAEDAEEGSAQSIIATLRGRSGEDPVLLARLFLALAEKLDRRDEDLEGQLAILTAEEGRLRELIRGPDGDPAAPDWLGHREVSPSLATPVQSEQRLRAWARLWDAGRFEDGWPVGQGVVVKDLLDEAYESFGAWGGGADLLRLPLSADGTVRPGREGGVRRLLGELLMRLPGAQPDELTRRGGGVQDLVSAVQGAWREAGGGVQEGGATLVLSVYPKRAWPVVLARAAGLDLSIPPAGETGWSFFLI